MERENRKMPKPKIVHYTRSSEIGGVEYVIKQMLLSEEGETAKYLFLRNINKMRIFADSFKKIDVKIIFYDEPKNLFDIKSIYYFIKKIIKNMPDTFYLHMPAFLSSKHVLFILKMLNVKDICVVVHGVGEVSSNQCSVISGDRGSQKRYDWISMERVCALLLRCVSKIIVVSNFVKGKILEFDDKLKDKIEVVYPKIGSSLDLRTCQAKKVKPVLKSVTDPFIMGCLCRLHPQKNLLFLIEVFRELQKTKKIILKIMGDGEQKNIIINKIKEYKLEDSIFLEPYNETKKYDFLKSLDLFVFPAINEAFGIVLLEAMDAGVYCCAANSGGIPEIIEHNKNGILFNPYDIDNCVLKLMHFFV